MKVWSFIPGGVLLTVEGDGEGERGGGGGEGKRERGEGGEGERGGEGGEGERGGRGGRGGEGKRERGEGGEGERGGRGGRGGERGERGREGGGGGERERGKLGGNPKYAEFTQYTAHTYYYHPRHSLFQRKNELPQVGCEFSFLPLMGGSVCLLLGNSGRPWRESETTPFPFSTSEAVPSSLRPLSVSLPSPSLSSPSLSATGPSVISSSTLCSSLVSGELVHVLSEGGGWREGGGQGSVERNRGGREDTTPNTSANEA